MPGTPGARTGLASILTGDPATGWRTTINAVISWLEGNAMLTSSGLLSARPTSTPGTPGIAGRRYYATDTGVEYRDTGTSWVALGVELVTALPASPYNGQIVDYLADATNGVVWRLRYRSASASAYKWEFVGGAPLRAYIAAQETVAWNAGYPNPATVGPTVTVPVAGDYDIAHSTGVANGTGGYLFPSFSVGATAATDADRADAGPGGNFTPTR